MKRLHTYSQHFLKSPRLVRELVGHSSIKKTDLVYDIGAGSGVISSVLAQRARRVVAIEAEPATAAKLRANMAKFDNVKVVAADFLQLPLPSEPYKVFANIPFHLSSDIVRKLTETEHPPRAIYLIVQKQFARKLVPSPQHFTGQLGAMIGPNFVAKIRRPLRRTDYFPHPNVDTVLLEIVPRPTPLVLPASMPAYRKFVANCFSTPKIFQAARVRYADLPADIKPSELSIDDWVKLFDAQVPPKSRL